jgi:hypothetical protein
MRIKSTKQIIRPDPCYAIGSHGAHLYDLNKMRIWICDWHGCTHGHPLTPVVLSFSHQCADAKSGAGHPLLKNLSGAELRWV